MTKEEAIEILCDQRKGNKSEAMQMALKALQEPEIIHCKYCKHKPSGDITKHDITFPDDNECPCQCEDYWYSWIPDDNWFCANGEKREE